MKLTTITTVSVDGVMQAPGPSPEDRRGGFERDGWALPLYDDDAAAFFNHVYQRADAFLFGRRTYEHFADTWGAIAEMRAHTYLGFSFNAAPMGCQSDALGHVQENDEGGKACKRTRSATF